jgi:hypothetical protein
MIAGDREAIFARIREALREPAPRHHEKPAASATPSVTACACITRSKSWSWTLAT